MEPCVLRTQGYLRGLGAKTMQSEGRSRTVAKRSLESVPIVQGDLHGSVEADAAPTPPGEHAGGVGLG